MYREDAGYGFIRVDTGGDLFFHISDWPDDCDAPIKGARVSFVIGKSRDGRPCATDVRPIAVGADQPGALTEAPQP